MKGKREQKMQVTPLKSVKEEVRIVNELVCLGFTQAQAIDAFMKSSSTEIKDVIDCIQFQQSREKLSQESESPEPKLDHLTSITDVIRHSEEAYTEFQPG